MKYYILVLLIGLAITGAEAQSGLEQGLKLNKRKSENFSINTNIPTLSEISKTPIIGSNTDIIIDKLIDTISSLLKIEQINAKLLDSLSKNITPKTTQENVKLLKELASKNKIINANIDVQKVLFTSQRKYANLIIENAIKEHKAIIKSYLDHIDSVNKKIRVSNKAYNNEEGDTIFKIDTLMEILSINNQKLKLEVLKVVEDIKIIEEIIDSTRIQKNTNFAIKTKKINEDYKLFDVLNKKIEDSFEKLKMFKIKLTESLITKINEEYAKITEPKPNTDISTMPEIITAFGSGLALPSLNLLGTTDFDWHKFKGRIKVFSTAGIATNANRKFDWRSITLPESSNFGIQFNLSKGFRGDIVNTAKGKISSTFLRFNGSYVNKAGQTLGDSIPSLIDKKKSFKPDTVNFEFGMIHLRPGIEYVFAENVFSIYADYNLQFSINNISFLKSSYEKLSTERPIGFFNFGLRFRVETSSLLKSQSKSTFLIFDLNFISLTNVMRTIGSTKDKWLPVLKTGIKF